jgi:micrococcal nuclease
MNPTVIRGYQLTFLLFAFLLISFLWSGCITVPFKPPSGAVQASVTRVVDGDTIVVNIQGTEYKLRYIGIDTPEVPPTGAQPFGREAAAKNRELVEGKVVSLEKDVSETDRYGRLLRYVWVDGLMVNAEMVRLGYAYAYTYPPDVRRQETFRLLEKEARDSRRGLWAARSSE